MNLKVEKIPPDISDKHPSETVRPTLLNSRGTKLPLGRNHLNGVAGDIYVQNTQLQEKIPLPTRLPVDLGLQSEEETSTPNNPKPYVSEITS